MKKFIVYLLVIVMVVSVGFAVFYLVRDNEVISISSASIYKDVGDKFTLDVDHHNKKSYTEISITSSDDEIVSGKYDEENGQFNATANKGGVARINVRTSNAKFRNLWCDVIVGDGTLESPFYISTAEQLAAIGMGEQRADKPGVYRGAPGYEKYESDMCYKLVANIDVSTVNNGYWVPLQNFNGRLDGNGCTVSNVYIDAVGYKEVMGDKADIRFLPDRDAGFLASIGIDGIVYNLKLDNYMAVGTYSHFGTVAAVNYGKIERLEVKDAYLSIKTGVFGGIAGANVTTESLVVETDDEGRETASYKRNVARIDRTSVNLTLGQTRTVDPAGNATISILGATGTVGGIVGLNMGGNLVYSYARGEVYFGDDSALKIVYGGIIAENNALNSLHENDSYDSEFQGASIKDCYSDLTTVLIKTPVAESLFGGAIGINKDYQNGTFEDPNNLLVNNYLIGNYYNKENLNKQQDNITKNFVGIAKFMLDETPVTFADEEAIIYGLTAEEMTDGENFVSHSTIQVEFNEDGTSKGLVQKEVLWLFDSVWAIDTETNDGMPYLNYQLVYIPEDFSSVGVPIVADELNDYYFEMAIDYPISILSGTDGKVRVRVEEFYQLVYSPTGIELEWTSSDESIVKVDPQTGMLEGIRAGVASVTAKTKSGSQATVTVIVENIPYRVNAPETIYLYPGENYTLNNITITPDPTTTSDEAVYSLTDASGNATSLVWIEEGKLIAGTDKGTAVLNIKIADTSVNVNVVVVDAPQVKLSASPSRVTGYIDSMVKNGTITISHQSAADVPLTYNTTFIVFYCNSL